MYRLVLVGMILMLLSSSAFAIGGAFMKPSDGFTRFGPSLAVAACFLSGTVLLARAVQQGSLSTTYVIALGLEATVAVGVGMLVLGERVSLIQAAGIALIVSGLVVVHTG
jgi:multidrug transporter EmrE-like cation transporter